MKKFTKVCKNILIVFLCFCMLVPSWINNETASWLTSVTGNFILQAKGASVQDLAYIRYERGGYHYYYHEPGATFVSGIEVQTKGAWLTLNLAEKIINAGNYYPNDTDLNDAAGGDYIKFGFSMTDDPSRAFTKIAISSSENGNIESSPTWPAYYGFSDTEKENTVIWEKSSPVDLNKEAGGAYLYFCNTHDTRVGAPLTLIYAQSAATAQENENYARYLDNSSIADLNQDAGGDYIYLYQTSEALTDYAMYDNHAFLTTSGTIDVSAALEELQAAYNYFNVCLLSNRTGSDEFKAFKAAMKKAKTILAAYEDFYDSTYTASEIEKAISDILTAVVEFGNIYADIAVALDQPDSVGGDSVNAFLENVESTADTLEISGASGNLIAAADRVFAYAEQHVSANENSPYTTATLADVLCTTLPEYNTSVINLLNPFGTSAAYSVNNKKSTTSYTVTSKTEYPAPSEKWTFSEKTKRINLTADVNSYLKSFSDYKDIEEIYTNVTYIYTNSPAHEVLAQYNATPSFKDEGLNCDGGEDWTYETISTIYEWYYLSAAQRSVTVDESGTLDAIRLYGDFVTQDLAFRTVYNNWLQQGDAYLYTLGADTLASLIAAYDAAKNDFAVLITDTALRETLFSAYNATSRHADCEQENAYLSFEECRESLQAAADAVDITRTTCTFYVETYFMNTEGVYPATADNRIALTTYEDVAVSILPDEKEGFSPDVESSTLSGIASAQEDVTLRIYYIRNQYNVSLSASQDGIEGVSGEGRYYYAAPVTLNAVIADGYTWKGWTGTYSVAEQNALFTMPAEDVYAKATSSLSEYSIVYSLDGGVFTTKEPTSFNIQSDTVTLPVPEKAGAAFVGWTGTGLTAPLTEVIIPDGSTGDRLYVANWENSATTAILASGNCGAQDNNVQWELHTDGTLYIFGKGAMMESTSASALPWHELREYIQKGIIEEGVTSVSHYAFEDCENLVSIELPDSLTSIGVAAMHECSSLTEITIPDKVTTIQGRAFRDCSSLQSVTIGNGVTSIGYEAFSLCAVPTIVIPANVKNINVKALSSCSDITVLNPYCTISDSAFGTGKTISGYKNSTAQTYAEANSCGFIALDSGSDIVLTGSCGTEAKFTLYKDGVLHITGTGAMTDFASASAVPWYSYRQFVKSVEVADTITSIGNYAFYYEKQLTNINIPNSVTRIGTNAFYNCTALTSVIIGDNVTSIGTYAFYNCTALSSVIISDSVASIADYAFSNCTALNEFNIPNSVTSVAALAFSGCTTLTSISVDAGNAAFCADNGVLYNKDKTTLVFYPAGKQETAFIIPDSVVTIGAYAFRYCDILSNITIPDTVTTIEKEAFYNCEALAGVSIPYSVKAIGDYAFYSCYALTDIYIYSTDCTFYNSSYFVSSGTVMHGFSGSTAQTYASTYSKTFRKLTCKHERTRATDEVPPTCTMPGITASVFCTLCGIYVSGNKEIAALRPEGHLFDTATHICTICSAQAAIIKSGDCSVEGSDVKYTLYEDGVLEIYGTGEMKDDRIFGGLNLLFSIRTKSVIIKDGVTNIGDEAFSGLTKITSVSIADSVTSIGYNAFYNCKALTEINVPAQVDHIAFGAFEKCSSMTAIQVEASNEYYTSENGVLYNKDKTMLLCYPAGKPEATFEVPDSVKDIESNAFYGCTALTRITIPDSVTNIGFSAFEDCSALTTVTFGENSQLTSIGYDAFYECSSLTDITIPDSVTSIGSSSFEDCFALAEITIPAGVTSIGSYVFRGCGALTAIHVEAANENYSSENGVLYNKDKTTLICYPAGKPEAAFTVPDSVVSIDNYAFQNCTSLTCVAFGENSQLASVSSFAFYECESLTEISLPDSVTSIDRYAFGYCSALTRIFIPDSVTSIGSCAFYSCTALAEITIPASVTSIESSAFYACSALTDIYIYNNACVIDDSANTISDTAVIHGFNNSTAQAYATTYKRTFEVIPCAHPDTSEVEGFAATCTTSGLTDGIYCNFCQTWISKREVIPMLGHDYIACVVDPTCTVDGYTRHTCSRCQNSYTDTAVSALKHDYAATHVVPSDGSDSHTRYDCSRCQNSYIVLDPAVALDGVMAQAQIHQIGLSWYKAVEATVTGYNIYKKAENESEFKLCKYINGRNNLSYIDTNVQVGTVYEYYICALKGDVIGENSVIVTSSPLVDTEAPYIKTFTPADYSVLSGIKKISINAQDNIGVAKIELYYSTDNGESWTLLQSASGSSFSNNVNTTQFADGEILFRALAYDTTGNVSDGLPARHYKIDNTGPDQVMNVRTIEIYSATATLAWDDVAAEDYASFVLERKSDAGTYARVASGFNGLGYHLTGLRPATTYTYRIAAVDCYGNIGIYSEDFTFTTLADTTAPSISSLSSASRCNTAASFRVTAQDECGIASIAVQISFDGTTWATLYTKTYTSNATSQTLSYSVNTASYPEGIIKVKAVVTDTSGNVNDSLGSADTTADDLYVEYYVDHTAPAAPQNVQAAGLEGTICISWTMGMEDDIGKYSIYRSTSENGTYSCIVSDLSKVSYYDKTTVLNTRYYYKVAVKDTVGNISAFSPVVSATMLEDLIAPQVPVMSPASGSRVGSSFNTVNIATSDNNALQSVTVEYKTSSMSDFEVHIESVALAGKSSGSFNMSIPISNYNDSDVLHFRAKATDAAGHVSAYSATYTYTIDKTAPVIKNAQLSVANGVLKVAWANNGESDLSGYKVYLQKDNGNFTQIATCSRNNANYSVSRAVSEGGTYKVRITAFDVVGNSSSQTLECSVAAQKVAPIARISAVAEMEIGVAEYFNASSSTDSDGTIISYYWDFGDGTTSTAVKQIKSYTEAGTYTVSLTVTDSDGLTSTKTQTVTVVERQLLGILNVTVIDENGKTVPYVPVTFDLGTNKQTKYATNASGVASIKATAGRHNVGVYVDQKWLPVQKTAVVIGGATTALTIRVISGSVIEGYFEVNRMTPEEIEAAGLDVYDTANRQVYKGSVRVTYGSSSYTINYNRAGGKILKYDYIYDSTIGPSPTGTTTPSSRKPIAVTTIPVSDDVECIAVIDVPAEISYLKECFDVQLHILNNATEDFQILNSTIHLSLPDGLSLVSYANGFENSLTVEIPVINTRETTIRWMVMGDKEGSYDLNADFAGTMSLFNEPVTASFKTDEPIKVYGASAVKFTYDFDSELRYGAFYFNVGMENVADIDVLYPMIGLQEDSISNIAEMMKAEAEKEEADNNDSGEETQAEPVEYSYTNITVFELGLVLEDSTGYKKYLAEMPKLIAPGQKLYMQYVAYGIADAKEVGYFNNATVTEVNHDGIAIEVNSVDMSHYGLDDPITNFETIFASLSGNDGFTSGETTADQARIQQAFEYLITHENFMYWEKAGIDEDGFLQEIIDNISDNFRTLFDMLKTVLSADLKLETLTAHDLKLSITSMIAELLSSDSFVRQVNYRIDEYYASVAKDYVETLEKSFIATIPEELYYFTSEYYDENGDLYYQNDVSLSPFKDLLTDTENFRKLISQLKNNKGETLIDDNKFTHRLANVVISSIAGSLTTTGKTALRNYFIENPNATYSMITDSFETIAKSAGFGLEMVSTVAQASNASVQIYNALFTMAAAKAESVALLDALIAFTQKDFSLLDMEKLIPMMTDLSVGIDYKERVFDTINIVCKELKESLEAETIRRFDIFIDELGKIGAEKLTAFAAKKAAEHLVGVIFGTPVAFVFTVIGLAFDTIDYLFKISDKYKSIDNIRAIAVISQCVQLQTYKLAASYPWDTFSDKNYTVAIDTLNMLRYTIVSRLIGERFFIEYAELIEKKIGKLYKQVNEGMFDDMSAKEIEELIQDLHAQGAYNTQDMQATPSINEAVLGVIDPTATDYNSFYRNAAVAILQARDVLFNSKTTIVTIPEAPELSLDYNTLQTVQSFSSEYEYCFGDGVWKTCDNKPISFTIKNVSQTLRVRKAASETELSGNIASVNIYAKKTLPKHIGVRFDGAKYMLLNLPSSYSYDVILTNSTDESFESATNYYIVVPANPVIECDQQYDYIIIRSRIDNILNAYYSDPIIRAVENTIPMNIIAQNGGTIEGNTNCFEGDIVCLQAVACEGYRFMGWYLEDTFVQADPYLEFNAYKDAKVEAKFEEILPESLVLETECYTVEEGKTMSLCAVVTPETALDRTVTWSSSANTVATVNTEGVVSAVSAGEAVITATTKNGISASVTITVFAHEHSFGEWIGVTEPTCTTSGTAQNKCTGCDYAQTITIPASGHAYDANGICVDCNDNLFKDCEHFCHDDGVKSILWKIIRLFWKLFGMNSVCECGAAHY